MGLSLITRPCLDWCCASVVRKRQTHRLAGRASHATPTATASRTAMSADTLLEQHFTVQALAERWALSTDAIRCLFEDEPGVLKMGDRQSGRKRRYVTLRVPETVAARVYRRLCNEQGH